MANWIPKIVYTEVISGTGKTITFDSPPDGDPLNERESAKFTQNRSASGRAVTQFNYSLSRYDLNFKFQSQTVLDKVRDFVRDHSFHGADFKYYIHSDEADYETFIM